MGGAGGIALRSSATVFSSREDEGGLESTTSCDFNEKNKSVHIFDRV